MKAHGQPPRNIHVAPSAATPAGLLHCGADCSPFPALSESQLIPGCSGCNRVMCLQDRNSTADRQQCPRQPVPVSTSRAMPDNGTPGRVHLPSGQLEEGQGAVVLENPAGPLGVTRGMTMVALLRFQPRPFPGTGSPMAAKHPGIRAIMQLPTPGP